MKRNPSSVLCAGSSSSSQSPSSSKKRCKDKIFFLQELEDCLQNVMATPESPPGAISSFHPSFLKNSPFPVTKDSFDGKSSFDKFLHLSTAHYDFDPMMALPQKDEDLASAKDISEEENQESECAAENSCAEDFFSFAKLFDVSSFASCSDDSTSSSSLSSDTRKEL
jgi:hypothetical protein